MTMDDQVTVDTGPHLRGPMRRFLGLTWVGWLNRLVLRWFFVRLAYRVYSDNTFGGYFLIRWVWPFPWATVKRIGAGRRDRRRHREDSRLG